MRQRQKRGRTMVKPTISNVNPADLDAETIKNMNAVGINFAMKQENKLK